MGRKKNKHLKNKVSVDKNLCDDTIVETKNNLESLGNSETDSEEVHTVNGKLYVPMISNEVLIKLEDEVDFEPYHPNSQRVAGREYYVHSLCQICKQDPIERVMCPKCQFITYCSHAHRREHWPVHTDLCSVIVDVCKERQVDHIMQGALNFSPEKFRIFRFQNMVECEIKVERPLDKWEKEMFIFPNVCGVCHEYNIKNLVVCNFCHHSGFCKGHQMESHNEWCEHLLRYKTIVNDQNRFGIVCPSVPNCKIPLVLPKLINIQYIFKSIFNHLDVFEFLELTEITTYPLSALNALLTTNNEHLFSSEKITLHIVGAETNFEAHTLEKWEYYVLHLIPGLQRLEIEFIGPELNIPIKTRAYNVCQQCLKARKSISFKFHNQLYHTFSDKPNFSKPNLICAYNPGLYRTTGFNGEDTWSPTIASMFTKNCPVLTTAYTHKEILLDVERVKSIQDIHLVKEPTLNSFSSMKPSLNFVSDEDLPIIFKNHFYCVMC